MSLLEFAPFCIYRRVDKAFLQAAEELCSDRNFIFQLSGGRVLRFSFSAVFVSFLLADKIPEKKRT